MAKSFYTYIRETWKDPKEGKLKQLQWERLQEWRKQGAIVRLNRPTRLDKASTLGYKAKQGIVVVRVSVRNRRTRAHSVRFSVSVRVRNRRTRAYSII